MNIDSLKSINNEKHHIFENMGPYEVILIDSDELPLR